ncbi:hypothetical protein HG535_0F03470 [Zygotorulaspora mrakii]|uniref:AAA+ ATPase domain-containing protein n=1 Tax=Zygotorulaspora mrakii TaxID=42260 RepID=A0A7H9B698_ZYGMR|nr:uncharacterized protein HG535_0F03470 [Zygotorulaspora mrakii]QLG73836.1 hypothetical protein HG535_0F03470 [Zygotorulaspora mrakii]
MESSGNYHLLSKFTRLRKRPQQPLTDLTELYGKIANETIFYLKLEDQKNYKGALQGWKALNTDVMYRLTVIEHEYPNVQSYTREELNIKSGLRELYNKSLDHLERVKALYQEDEVRTKSATSTTRTSSKHTVTAPDSRKSSFNRRPPMFRESATPLSSRKMATTLRDPKLKSLRAYNQPSTNDFRSSGSKVQSRNKVNFTPSKPLIKANQVRKDDQNQFEDFDDNIDLIVLAQESEGEEDGEEDGEDRQRDQYKVTSPLSDQFEFDVEDYYGSLMDESGSGDDDYALNDLEENTTNLSINSSPLDVKTNISAPELPVIKSSEVPTPTFANIIKNRPPIPSAAPPSLPHQTPSSAGIPLFSESKPSKNTSRAATIKSEVDKSFVLHNPTSVSSDNVISKKTKPVSKTIPGLRLKATKSTSALAPKQAIVPSLPTKAKVASSYEKRPQVATEAAKLVLGTKPEQVRRVLPKKNSLTSSTSTFKKTQSRSTVGSRPSTARPKKDLGSSAHIKSVQVGGNGKANSMNSLISNESSSHSKGQTREKSAPPPEVPLAEDKRQEPEFNGSQLKEVLENEIIESLQGVDKTAAKQIFAEIVVRGDEVHWDDIAGLESAKSSLKEAVVYPFLRPDLFRGLREPVRGMLLFGPPGTGKTMLARAVATESHSTFFSISASSLTSKYLGESEKLVRALFAVAKKLSPSIVFVDEIDSIMGSRDNEGENESSRRIKNEFLIQWSSLSSAAAGNTHSNADGDDDERVLVLAATNLPWSIDEAARRRFVRRQYIPLPEPETRSAQLKRLLSYQKHTMANEDFLELLNLTDGFSGSDLTSLAKDAAMGPLRELGDKLLLTPTELVRPITLDDFKSSLNYIKPSVSQEGLQKYEDWASKFGSSGV